MNYKYFKEGMTPDQLKMVFRKYIEKYHNGDPKNEAIFAEIKKEYYEAKEQADLEERKRTGTLTGWDKAIMAEDATRQMLNKTKNAAIAFVKDSVNSAKDEYDRRVTIEQEQIRRETKESQAISSIKYTKEDYSETIKEYKKYLIDRVLAVIRSDKEGVYLEYIALLNVTVGQAAWEYFQYKMIPNLEEKGKIQKSRTDGHAIREKLEWIVYQFNGRDENKTEQALLKLEPYFGQFIIDSFVKLTPQYCDPVLLVGREESLKKHQNKKLSTKISNRYRDAVVHFTILFVFRFGLAAFFLIVETLFRISYILHGEIDYLGELVIWISADALVVYYYITGAFGNARRHLRLRRARFDREQMRIDNKKGPIFRFLAKHDII